MSCHGFWQDHKVLQYIAHKNYNNGSVVFSFSNEHFNLYDEAGARSLAQWPLTQEAQRVRLERIDPDAAVRDSKRVQAGLEDLKPWAGFEEDPPTGHFYVDSSHHILDVRRALLASGRCPRMLWSSLTKPRLLIYALTRKEASSAQGDFKKLYVHNVPPERHFLQAASDKLLMPYRMEGLSSFVQRAFRECLRGKREPITTARGDFEEAGQQVPVLLRGIRR